MARLASRRAAVDINADRRGRGLQWVGVGVAVSLVAVALDAARLPAATLFAALLVGLAVAVSGQPRAQGLALPAWADTAANAAIGVLIGALVQPDRITAIADDWPYVLAAVVATLAASVAAGMALGLHRDFDQVTGAFALVAGGASGVTAISQQLGADQRIVAVVQYIRVLVIVLAMPAVAAVLPTTSTRGADVTTSAADGSLWTSVVFTVGCAAGGLVVARLARLPAGPILGPLLLAAALAAGGAAPGVSVPIPVEELAYAAIGLGVGLSFTRSSLRVIRRMLLPAVGLVLALLAATAAVGIPVLRLAGASYLDAYLATTPGGMYAVLATAADTGSDTTLIAAVQVARLLAVLVLAPVLAVVLRPRRQPRGGTLD